MNFYASQVTKVDAGQVAVRDDNGNTTLVSYKGTGENRPVNMDTVTRFQRDTARDGSGSVDLPVITFKDITSEYTCWYYPPTEEGEGRRDADYYHLKGDFVVTLIDRIWGERFSNS